MINQRSVSYSRSVSISTGKIELSEEEKAGILNLKRKFWWFSTIASINHALNYVVTSFATSLLSPHLGGVILGLSWTLNAVSGLTVATAVVRRFGFKYAMIISLWGYAGQIASLYFAIIAPASAWVIAIVGSVVAGFTSAIWWTAQGVYFEQSSIEIEKIMPKQKFKPDPEEVSTIDTIRAELSAHWTIIYQVSDIVVFLALSAIPLAGGVSIDYVILGLVFVGIFTALLGFTFDPLGTTTGEMTFAQLTEAVVAVPVQMKNDARVLLLSPFVFGFGISTAMFAYYVNSSIISDSSGLGTLSLGFLEAFSYFVAVISAYPYAWVSSNFKQGQDWVIQFGSLSFLLSGAVVLGLSKGALGTWQNILIAKGLYGLGRGVFEGSCRAVYAAMFTGKELSTAFSSQTLSAGFSGGICFFLFNILSKDAISAITVGNGVLALFTYAVLMFMVNSRVPLSWGNLFTVCFSRSALEHDVESTPERAVNKYSKTTNKSGLKTSLLDGRDSEQDLFTVNNVLHHKMQVTPTSSVDDSRLSQT